MRLVTKGSPWDTPCTHTIILTGLVSIDPDLKRIIHFCGFLVCVFLLFSAGTKFTYRSLSLPQCVTKMVCLPSFLSSTRNESCFKDRLDVERTTYMEYKFFPLVPNLDATHQIPVLSYSHQCVLE